MLAQANKNIEALHDELSDLAMAWRGTKDARIADRYRELLREMMKRGFRQPLDFEDLLPDAFMPLEYLHLHSHDAVTSP